MLAIKTESSRKGMMIERTLLGILLLVGIGCGPITQSNKRPSEAGAAFLYWTMARTYPDGQFHTEKYTEALAQRRLEAQLRGGQNAWEALGPANIGGRTLCLAIHPLDSNILWAGSASGGLWKTTKAGSGPNAWQRVETGHPVLGVGAIAIDPSNPKVMYIGTGEVYNLENSAPNVAFRTTRGTYGIGILKSTDGGVTWTKSLDWSYGDLRGVQDIQLNPLRPATVFAATTEGLYRSYDAGKTWANIHPVRMAVDIALHPTDTTKLYVTYGSLDDQTVSGIYRTSDAGKTFAKLAGGLPASFSGKTLLAISPNQPNTLYASVGDAFAQKGLYKTTNGGDTWTRINNTDVCKYQGWYSHDIAVHPLNPNIFIWTGIDTWKSVNGGTSVAQKTYWYKWIFGAVPAGGPEGPRDYVHADIHAVYYHPTDHNKVYSVSDGGIFVSYDGGESWSGRNGGYQTQQFYANMGHSTTNPKLSIGGMQDNSTAIYKGSPSWTRVLGGDGECAAINPLDDQIMYGSSQYLNVYKSPDGGQSFFNVTPQEASAEEAAFNGPFELAPSNPNIMYFGAERLHRSDDGGDTSTPLTTDPLAEGDVVLTIGVSPQNPDLLYCSTAPLVTNKARVFKIDAANNTVTAMQGLPDRLCMDIAISPEDDRVAYAAFAGFNTEHVFKTTDGGDTWTSSGKGLPDVPTNSLLIDPLQPNHVYIGNDLGVWLSQDAGISWALYSADAPQAMLAMHLGIAPPRKLRVGTYGLGVWQTDLAFVPTSAPAPLSILERWDLAPNPASEATTAHLTFRQATTCSMRLLDAQGKTLWHLPKTFMPIGTHRQQIPLGNLPSGTYGLLLEGPNMRSVKVLVKK